MDQQVVDSSLYKASTNKRPLFQKQCFLLASLTSSAINIEKYMKKKRAQQKLETGEETPLQKVINQQVHISSEAEDIWQPDRNPDHVYKCLQHGSKVLICPTHPSVSWKLTFTLLAEPSNSEERRRENNYDEINNFTLNCGFIYGYCSNMHATSP